VWILLNTLFGALFAVAAAGMGVEEVECERVNAKGTRSGEATAGGRSCFALLSAMRSIKPLTPRATQQIYSQSRKLLPPPTVSTDAYVSRSSPLP
jgi:hypothetical protein